MMAPAASVRKSPWAEMTIGAPAAVPTPRRCNWAGCFFRVCSIASCSLTVTPLLIRRICPRPCAPCCSNSMARCTARSARCPETGIRSGCMACSKFVLVSKSLLSGTKVCALPAYTTNAVAASSRLSRRLITFWRIWCRRLGARSLAKTSGVN